MNASHRIALSVLLMLSAAPVLRAQEIAPGTPVPVIRRLAQAVWPENLFDTTGRPEPGFVQLPFRPQYSDLTVARHADLPERFAGVILYAGSAYPSGCVHCRQVRRAVAQRGSLFVTLLEPAEVEQILPWAAPAFTMTDSVELRQAIVGLLDASCLVGCGVRRVRERSDVPHPETWRAADLTAGQWVMPRTYSHVSSASLTLEFPVLAPEGLFHIKAALDRRGDYSVVVLPIAHQMLGG